MTPLENAYRDLVLDPVLTSDAPAKIKAAARTVAVRLRTLRLALQMRYLENSAASATPARARSGRGCVRRGAAASAI
jgi:hypothetical protein